MQSAAYAIALNILQNGIRAQPYLRPAVEANTPKLIENIKLNCGAEGQRAVLWSVQRNITYYSINAGVISFT